MNKTKFTTDPRDEVFDVVNEKDEVVGETTRGQAHNDPRLIHRVCHIWILNDKGEILLQQRSLTKDSAPGQWDISCGGHVRKGDNPNITAERELKEELGISADCKYITKFLERFTNQSEMVYLFYAYHNGPFSFPKDEIQQVKFLSKDKVYDMFDDPNSGVSFFSKKEIPMVYRFLENK